MIRLTDGIRIETTAGDVIIADGRRSVGDTNIVSHAHTDHLLTAADARIVCSRLTAALAEERTGLGVADHVESTATIELVPSGHVLGSRAAVIDDGRRILYTGDLNTRDRLYLEGFDPIDADVLIIESTYGIPTYRFPPQDRLEKQIEDWIRAAADAPLFLFGYPFGRAQKLLALTQRVPRVDRVYAAGSIRSLNDVIERHTDIAFPTMPFDPAGSYRGGDVVVLPASRSGSDAVARLVDRVDGVTAGFSGWAVADSFRYRGNYDAAFPLSDHCDFDELVGVVESVDPEVVYTHHGFEEAFARHLSTELGYDARPLKKHQSMLTDF